MDVLLRLLVVLGFVVSSCASDHDFERGNSTPINGTEANLYKQAIIRCHKTGGTRVVKINGQLRCF
jgi:hypothetical protein